MATSAEERFKTVVRDLHAEGIYPGPTAINRRLYGEPGAGYKVSNHLNGRQTRWRREMFAELEIEYMRPNAALPLTDYDVEDGSYLGGW